MSRLAVLLALLVAAGAGLARADVALVREVRFEGNRIVEGERLGQEVETKPGAPLDPQTLSADVKALFRLGYFRDVRVDVTEEETGAVVTFRLTENPRIREVRFEGNDELDEEKLLEVVKSRSAELLDDERVREDVRALTALYDQEGYTHARVESDVLPVGDTADIVFRIQENEEVYVVEFLFSGNEAFDDDEFIGVTETQEKWFLSWLTERGQYRKETLDGDVARMSALYLDHGYLEHKIGEPRLDFRDDGLHVHVDIEEGPQYAVSTISFEGDTLPDVPEPAELMTTSPGNVLSRSELRTDLDRLEEVYADRGYAFAEITPYTKLDREEKTVALTIAARKGEKVRFRRIEVEGNTKTRDKVVRREVRVREGGSYSGSRLKYSKQRLERLGFFEEVELEEKRTAKPDEVDLLVKVKEAQTGTLSAGAGFSSVDAFIFNVRVSQYNFLGRGQTLILNGDIGSERQLADFTFSEPYLFDIPLLASIRLFSLDQSFNDFDRSRIGGAFTLGYPLFEFVEGLGTYSFERVEIDDVARNASDVLLDAEGTDRISALTGTLRRKTLNNLFDPTRGSDNALSLKLAGTFLGGTSDFWTFEAHSAWYFPVAWDVVWSLRGRLGYGDSLESGEDLPLFERFFAGGINSVRGFDSRSLGPKDPRTGDEIGGNKELELTTELIVPLVPRFGLKGVVFFDAGEAYLEGSGYDLDKLRTAVGFGFRWLSPLGPLRLEIGYPLVRRQGDDASTLQFSVGGPV